MSPAYKLVRPHMDFVLFQCIFPTLIMSPEDVELFEEDPQEFIRKVQDPIEEFTDKGVAAGNLLTNLALLRLKDTLPRMLPFIDGIVRQYTLSPLESRDHRQMDGVMVAMAYLAGIMRRRKKYKHLLEPFFVTYLLPEFASPVAYIR